MRIEAGRVYPSPGERFSREIMPRATTSQHLEAGLSTSPVGTQDISRAISLSRLSQQILQQALSVSMRLKAIAAEAAMTGTIDRASLAASIAEINKTLGQYGENLAPPPDAITGNDYQEFSSRFQELRPYLQRLSSIAEDIDRSRGGAEPQLHQIVNELSERLSVAMKMDIDIFSRSLAAIPTAERADDLHALVSSSRQFILTHPNAALDAQGNIATAAVVRLTG